MKADVQSQAEKEELERATEFFRNLAKQRTRDVGIREQEALEWATEFFRNNYAKRLTKDNSKRVGEIMSVDILVHEYLSGPESADHKVVPESGDKLVDRLTRSHSKRDLLPMVAAALIEDGHQLQGALRDFVVEFLREPNKWLARRPGRKSRDLAIRDATIGAAVFYVCATWGFLPTRNRETTSRACGASIAKEALAKGAGVHLGEENVIKAWRGFWSNAVKVCLLPPDIILSRVLKLRSSGKLYPPSERLDGD
jgi:hypothetical protein